MFIRTVLKQEKNISDIIKIYRDVINANICKRL